jgi:hypothetical protein
LPIKPIAISHGARNRDSHYNITEIIGDPSQPMEVKAEAVFEAAAEAAGTLFSTGYTDNLKMANEAKARNNSPAAGEMELKNFIDHTMTNRAAPYKRLKIGLVSESTKNLIKNKFGFNVQDIDIDKDGIIHAMDKKAHNLEPDDLLNAADVINTSQDITLSPEKHQDHEVLMFKKDIDGELIVLAEVRKKHDYLLVFNAWRKKKARSRSNAVQAPPGTYVQNDSPRAFINSLSSNSANKSSDSSDGNTLFQTGDRDIVEEAAGFDTWEEWRDYVLYMEEGDVGGYNAEMAASLDSDESLDAWFRTFHQNAVKAVNSRTETDPSAPRTQADAAASADREFLDIIRDDRAFDEFTEEAARIYNDSFRDAALDEEEAASMDAERELQDDMRRTLTHANWTTLFKNGGKISTEGKGSASGFWGLSARTPGTTGGFTPA